MGGVISNMAFSVVSFVTFMAYWSSGTPAALKATMGVIGTWSISPDDTRNDDRSAPCG